MASKRSALYRGQSTLIEGARKALDKDARTREDLGAINGRLGHTAGRCMASVECSRCGRSGMVEHATGAITGAITEKCPNPMR